MRLHRSDGETETDLHFSEVLIFQSIYPVVCIVYTAGRNEKVLTRQQAGIGSPIGDVMLRAPAERLSLEGAVGTQEEIDSMQEFMHRCGARFPADRPTMNEVAPAIETMFKACVYCIAPVPVVEAGIVFERKLLAVSVG